MDVWFGRDADYFKIQSTAIIIHSNSRIDLNVTLYFYDNLVIKKTFFSGFSNQVNATANQKQMGHSSKDESGKKKSSKKTSSGSSIMKFDGISSDGASGSRKLKRKINEISPNKSSRLEVDQNTFKVPATDGHGQSLKSACGGHSNRPQEVNKYYFHLKLVKE